MKKLVVYEKTASFDVDAQNGFTPLCPLELPVKGGNDIIEECNLNAARASMRFMSKDAHPLTAEWISNEDNPQLSPLNYKPNMNMYWNSHCIVGTPGFDLIKGLPHPSSYDFIVYKGVEKDMHPYSPIYHDLNKKISTGVIEFAKQNGIDTFILGGLALDFCLGEAALDLKKAGFRVVVNLGATRAIGDAKEFIEKAEKEGIEFIDSAICIEVSFNDLPF